MIRSQSASCRPRKRLPVVLTTGFAGVLAISALFGRQACAGLKPILWLSTFLTENGVPLQPFAFGLTAAVPVLTQITLGVLSVVWRVPLSVGLARGLRGCAVPIACILLLAYAVLAVVTLRQDRLLDATIRGSVRHNGKYLAETAGKEWPGPTR